MDSLDLTDKKLLDILQNRFPLCQEPYAMIAGELGLNTDQILARVQKLKAAGIIRRVGAVIDGGALGYHSTLCCCRLAESSIDEFQEAVNEIKFITHNYVRDHEYNIWFTLTTPTPEKQEELIQMLQEQFNIIIYSMPAEKVYKIKFALGMEAPDL